MENGKNSAGGRPPEKKPEPNTWKQIGLLTTVPFLLLGGAAVGYGFGWAFNRWLHTGVIGMAVCITFGIVAGFREILNMLKKM